MHVRGEEPMTLEMPPEELTALEEELTAFEATTRRRPLTCWRAWHREEPGRTSQRAVLQQLAATKELVVFGGQRSGKSAVLRAANVALALGSDHPDARAFWLAHDMDPDAFPPGPGTVIVVARTSAASLRYHRDPYMALIPRWGPPHPMNVGASSALPFHAWNLKSNQEARVEIMVPGYTDPATIYFMSEQQGPDEFDGMDIRAAHHDEEGRTAEIYDKVQSRLIDHDGWQMFSNAPVKGKTWVYRRFELSGKNEPEVVVRRLYSGDNPYLPAHRVAKIANDPSKGRGEFVLERGRIWPMFSRETHVLRADQVLPALRTAAAVRFRGIDFGTRHPHCCLWLAVLRTTLHLPDVRGGLSLPDGTVVAYREHYQAGKTLAWHVERYRDLEGWLRDGDTRTGWRRGPETERIAETWADPEDAQQMQSLIDDHDIDATKGNKKFIGYNTVAEYLTPDETGLPQLFVLDCCERLISEILEYVWADPDEGEEGPTRPKLGQKDHACDPLRYALQGIRTYF